MTTPPATTVFIVEDSPGIRARLVELLSELDGVHVLGEAETPTAAVEAILDKRPDCVVLDYQLLGGTGLEVLRDVHPRAPDIMFIVLTNHPTPQYRRQCMDAGASFFLDKSTKFGRIRDLVGARPLFGQCPTNLRH